MTKLLDHVETLAARAAACAAEPGTTSPLAAMQFAQAALSLANTARCIADIPPWPRG